MNHFFSVVAGAFFFCAIGQFVLMGINGELKSSLELVIAYSAVSIAARMFLVRKE